jgi:deoxyribodipyrimidine photo-lyase
MERVIPCNSSAVKGSGDYVLYWMTAYRRTHFNFALERAVFWATELRKPLLIFEPLACNYRWGSRRFHQFVIDGMRENLIALESAPVTYRPFVEPSRGEGKKEFSNLAAGACLIVTDDFPAFEHPRWIETAASRSPVLMEKVDSNGLYPMRLPQRVFVTAHSFRRFLQKQPQPEFPLADPLVDVDLPRLKTSPLTLKHLDVLPAGIDGSVDAVGGIKGGASSARERLRRFVSSDASTSGLSPYLHFGHISAHEIYRAVTSAKRPDSEHFLDELITWRELGFNMCANRPDYDQYDSLPEWARNTLAKHAADVRPVLYSPDQLESAATRDDLWNFAQRQLVKAGGIENRLRMLWGKKILEWSATPEEALHTMIHLNNKYALDGRDPNSYTGIFWTLGRYDRPWGPERAIFGLVRYMSSASTAKKLKIHPTST